jgi:hypothetical protein
MEREPRQVSLQLVCNLDLLGVPFFESNPTGMEFDWYGTDGDPPTMIFYYGKELPDNAKNNTFCIPIEDNLFRVNGVEIRAIVDTGSCISIFESQRHRSCGIEEVYT